MLSFLCFFFFFQAEDGIRDRNVTGVQTCALPILAHHAQVHARFQRTAGAFGGGQQFCRSEERRVGKECRCRWWRDHEKKKDVWYGGREGGWKQGGVDGW